MPEATAPRPRHKALTLFLWLAVLPTIGMGLAGTSKFRPAAHWQDYFVGWGYPRWFALVIGATEVICAVMALIPRTAVWGAPVLSAIMFSAAATLEIHRDGPPGWSPVSPLVYGFVFAAVAAIRWREKLQTR
jgi:uncharacterized membrane protein YphA (DoxX/SURF4 family)